MNRKILLPAAAATAALALAGCSGGGDNSAGASAAPSHSAATSAKISVVASTDVWGSVASAVGGDKVTVTSIIDKPDADPHEYEANTRNQLSLSKAHVVIENGGGYDDFVDRMLKSAKNDSATVLNAVTISAKKAGAGEELNEHVWYNFPTVQKMVDQIESAYTKADAADQATFQSNADAFNAKLKDLEQQEASLKEKYAGTPASITEPVPLYMLDAIGLTNKTPEEFSEAIEEDSDVPASVLNQTLQLYSKHRVRLLAYNAQTTGPETEKLLAEAKQNNVPVVPVTETLPEGKDYVFWMSSNLQAISSALRQ